MNELELLAREAAGRYGPDPRLVCALCEVESGWNPWAVRYEPDYKWLWGIKEPLTTINGLNIVSFDLKNGPVLIDIIPSTPETELALQKTSWGLMQIMGAVARERGFRGWLTELCDPSISLEWGCKHLRWMADHNNAYGLPDFRIKPEDLAAAWNAGTRIVIDGKYKNQPYVDRVLRAMEGYQ